ncbi:nucleocapsid protein [Cachoeira Porteira virus]|uniref:Nucleoprotein n=1 Tax=Cachoeira Porteira virus TaxID=1138490 RepID=H6VX85_9VIRU|nr:nucleocapsid protein [Cachoeira Porteira virus]AEZ35285.1 nucleocapsid protein [Cachoeira Porteira virus]
MSEIAFEDVGQITSSTFNPDVQYTNFKRKHTTGLTYDNIRVFYINGKLAKEKLSKRSEETITLDFAGWKVLVYNTHFSNNRGMAIPDEALTLHRLSGYLARYVLERYLSVQEAERLLITTKIINPIAASHGITWNDGPEVYLSFFPGAEMFLEAFKFYPLAIGIYKVQKKLMEAKYLEKTMRQKYAGLDAALWTQQKYAEVTNAVAVVSGLGWKKSNVSAAARDFLSKFGIQL